MKPSKKAAQKLADRVHAYEAYMAKLRPEQRKGYHRPGSRNLRK